MYLSRRTPRTACTATRCTLSNFIFRAYDAAGKLWTITRHRVDTLESGPSLRKLLTRGLAVRGLCREQIIRRNLSRKCRRAIPSRGRFTLEDNY